MAMGLMAMKNRVVRATDRSVKRLTVRRHFIVSDYTPDCFVGDTIYFHPRADFPSQHVRVCHAFAEETVDMSSFF
jgi:hypothetical protein